MRCEMFGTKSVKFNHAFWDLGNGRNFGSNIVSVDDAAIDTFTNISNYGNDIFLSRNSLNVNFNSSLSTFYVFRNVVPGDRNVGLSSLEFRGFAQQMANENELNIWSSYPLNGVFGINFEGQKYGKLSLIDNKIYFNNPSFDKGISFLSFQKPIIVENSSFNIENLICIDRFLGTVRINVFNEMIVHPLASPVLASMRSKLEIDGNNANTHIMNISKYSGDLSNNIVFYRPLYMYSNDDGLTWYKWNVGTESFVNVLFSQQIPTFGEFIINANTYEQYSSIDENGWKTFTTSGKIRIMANTYVPTILVSHNAFELDSSEYLWMYRRTPRCVFLKGAV